MAKFQSCIQMSICYPYLIQTTLKWTLKTYFNNTGITFIFQISPGNQNLNF